MFSFKPNPHNSGKIGISGTGNGQKSNKCKEKGKYCKDRNKQDLVVLFYCLMLPENKKSHPMVPPLHHFQREKKIAHLLPERSAHRDDHFFQT